MADYNLGPASVLAPYLSVRDANARAGLVDTQNMLGNLRGMGILAKMQEGQQYRQAMQQSGGDLETVLPRLIQSGAIPPEHLPAAMKVIEDIRARKDLAKGLAGLNAPPVSAPGQPPVSPGSIDFMAANNEVMGLPPPERPAAAPVVPSSPRANAIADLKRREAVFLASPIPHAQTQATAIRREIDRLEKLDEAKHVTVGDKVYEIVPGQPPKEVIAGAKGRWGDPYELGGATVQKNLDTGEVRTAVSRPPSIRFPPPIQPLVQIMTPEGPKLVTREEAIGKTPAGPGTAAEKREEGTRLLSSELDNLRVDYTLLTEAEAIPSSDRGVAANIASSVRASMPGQFLGRVGGTVEQDARNRIKSARLRILNALKSATGMSSQQLNSNVELKTWLDSLTDPSNTYESNMGIIDAIEQSFVTGKTKQPISPAAPIPERRNTPRANKRVVVPY